MQLLKKKDLKSSNNQNNAAGNWMIFHTTAPKKYNIKCHRRRQIIEECAMKTGKCLHNHVARPAAELFRDRCVLLLLDTSVVALYCNI